MEIHYKVIGLLLIVLSIIHVIFPRYFNWSKELESLSLINRQMMYIHTFFVAFVVLLMGILCFTSATELLTTHLGKKVSFGFGIFWLARLYIQFFGYSADLWKGKPFETAVHILFSLFWAYFSIVFLWVF